jgi:hypothetical protein
MLMCSLCVRARVACAYGITKLYHVPSGRGKANALALVTRVANSPVQWHPTHNKHLRLRCYVTARLATYEVVVLIVAMMTPHIKSARIDWG